MLFFHKKYLMINKKSTPRKSDKDRKSISKMVMLSETDMERLNVVSSHFGNESAGVVFRRLLNNEFNSIVFQTRK